MNYKVIFSAKENKKENKITIYRNFGSIIIYINDVQVVEKQIKEIQPLFDAYNSGNIDGVHHEDRELTKLILTSEHPVTFHSLFKSFATVNVYLQYGSESLYSNHDSSSIKFFKDTFEAHCYNSLLVAWTGDLGTQPVMYLIKKEYYNSDDVNGLYELGLLNKILVEIGSENLLSYFVPFDIPNIPSIMIGRLRTTWHKIINDMDNKLSELNKR